MKAINLIKYLIVILDTRATSFCYYENNRGETSSAPGRFLPLEKLEEAVNFAIKNDISINFIYGNHTLPAGYDNLIETVKHIKIIPLDRQKQEENAILVINPDHQQLIPQLETEADSQRNIILRLEKDQLDGLGEIIQSLWGKFRRLNLFLLDIENYTESDFNRYEEQLKIVENFAVREYKAGSQAEINFLTDRLLLVNMNNCEAGNNHLTVGPNGKLYLCPGFYYDNPGNSIGNLENGYEIKNSQLLKLNNAPICKNCDAYHCKRCVYLNKKTTGELNTPSHQQCVLSHLERNTSGRLLEAVKPDNEMFREFTPIPAIPYLDPIDLVNGHPELKMEEEDRERLTAQILSKPLEKLSSKELLYRVYKLDKDLLTRLKRINHGE
jgi:CXXX repeat peptide maturase